MESTQDGLHRASSEIFQHLESYRSGFGRVMRTAPILRKAVADARLQLDHLDLCLDWVESASLSEQVEVAIGHLRYQRSGDSDTSAP